MFRGICFNWSASDVFLKHFYTTLLIACERRWVECALMIMGRKRKFFLCKLEDSLIRLTTPRTRVVQFTTPVPFFFQLDALNNERNLFCILLYQGYPSRWRIRQRYWWTIRCSLLGSSLTLRSNPRSFTKTGIGYFLRIQTFQVPMIQLCIVRELSEWIIMNNNVFKS